MFKEGAIKMKSMKQYLKGQGYKILLKKKNMSPFSISSSKICLNGRKLATQISIIIFIGKKEERK